MALNLKIVGVSASYMRVLSLRYDMKALPEQNLIFEVLCLKALGISNPKGLKKSNFSPKGRTTFKSCEMKLLVAADNEDVKISSFALFEIKL